MQPSGNLFFMQKNYTAICLFLFLNSLKKLNFSFYEKKNYTAICFFFYSLKKLEFSFYVIDGYQDQSVDFELSVAELMRFRNSKFQLRLVYLKGHLA